MQGGLATRNPPLLHTRNGGIRFAIPPYIDLSRGADDDFHTLARTIRKV